MICRTKKLADKVGKVLFINAKNEITKKDSFSFLEDKHIEKIISAYRNFDNIDGFAGVATVKDMLKNNSSLSIGLYVKNIKQTSETEEISIKDAYSQWLASSNETNQSLLKIVNEIKGGNVDE